MPVTISYDLANLDNNQRNYIRSAFERFGFVRLGGSVFRYELNGPGDDWLNCVAPAIMFFRSYVLKNGIQVSRFTVDCHGASFVDSSDLAAPVGLIPQAGPTLPLVAPTNVQSSEAAIRAWVDHSTTNAP